jgi:cyclomaltodextrinase
MSTVRTPEWVKDAVFYQIFPDRFARHASLAKPFRLEQWDAPPTHHGFKGGDLLGIVERLDYLQDLGINAIYLNPIFQSASNHRYQTHDYYQIDPMLGGNQALRQLLDAAHQRGMKVVLDGVFNHCGRGLYQFHHILENRASSPYIDWFSIKGFPLHAYDDRRKPNYQCWWDLRGLPKFNTRTPAVREFLWGVARHWIDWGIDGWRLDVPQEINDPPFWHEFRRRVKERNPEAYLVGEIWRIAPEWLEGDRFDGLMNNPFSGACLKFFVEQEVDPELVRGMGYAQGPRLTASEFSAAIDSLLNSYHPEITQALLNLLGSHDTPRFLTLARNDTSALRLATFFQMTYPGAPSLYYGDEIGLEGRRDPDCRRAFPWDEKRWDSTLSNHIKSCIALRRAHPALRRGEYTPLHSSDGVYVFGRRLQNETLIVALNVSPAVRAPRIKIDNYLTPGQNLRPVWSDIGVTVVQGVLEGVKLPPRSSEVWLAETMAA